MQDAVHSRPAMATRAEFIHAMRRVAGTVAIVTTAGHAGRHGATVSAFCSVSADPPSLLVCLHDDSRIARMILANRRFCINVLPQNFEAVADRFAGRQDHLVEDRFDGIACSIDRDCCPAIQHAIACQCEMASEALSGSHRVVIGNVVQVDGDIDRPLTYLDGAYRRWPH